VNSHEAAIIARYFFKNGIGRSVLIIVFVNFYLVGSYRICLFRWIYLQYCALTLSIYRTKVHLVQLHIAFRGFQEDT